MKGKLFGIIFLGCLMLFSCDKIDVFEVGQKDELYINGRYYEVDNFKDKLSILLNVPKDKLIYDESSKTFKILGFSTVLDPHEFVYDIEILENEY